MTPTKPGFCQQSLTSGKRHQHCRCPNNNKDINDCKSRCDEDNNCKGYSFRTAQSYCYVYTSTACPSECELRASGFQGEITEGHYYDWESGCYLKIIGREWKLYTLHFDAD